MTTRQLIGFNLRVLPDTEDQAAQAAETLTRVMTGLAMDGIGCTLEVTPYDHDPEDTQP